MAKGKKRPAKVVAAKSNNAEALVIPVRVVTKAGAETSEAEEAPVEVPQAEVGAAVDAADVPVIDTTPQEPSSDTAAPASLVVPEPELLKELHIPGPPVVADDTSDDDIDDDDYDDEDEWDDDDYDDEPELPRGKRAVRALRNAALGTVGVLAILVGAGAAYTYFMGGSGSMQSATPVAVTAPDPTAGMVKPRKPSPKVPESASVQFISSPVKRGGAASLSVQTLPASSCTVIVDHEHIAVPMAGLKKKTADDFGTVSWDWTIPKSMPSGTSTATVMCSYKERSAMVQGDIVVQ